MTVARLSLLDEKNECDHVLIVVVCKGCFDERKEERGCCFFVGGIVFFWCVLVLTFNVRFVKDIFRGERRITYCSVVI